MQVGLMNARWKDPYGLLAYTRNSTYPDLLVYFNANDTTSPVNVAATKVRGKLWEAAVVFVGVAEPRVRAQRAKRAYGRLGLAKLS